MHLFLQNAKELCISEGPNGSAHCAGNTKYFLCSFLASFSHASPHIIYFFFLPYPCELDMPYRFKCSYHRVFPAICKHYRVSLKHTQYFPLRSIGFLCSLFFIDIAGKTYGNPVNPCVNICSVSIQQWIEYILNFSKDLFIEMQ